MKFQKRMQITKRVLFDGVQCIDPSDVDDNLNPFFKEHVMSLEELCYCDLDWPLRISIFDWERSGKHKLIGQVRLFV